MEALTAALEYRDRSADRVICGAELKLIYAVPGSLPTGGIEYIESTLLSAFDDSGPRYRSTSMRYAVMIDNIVVAGRKRTGRNLDFESSTWMTNLKDQIEDRIRKERERSEKPGQNKHKEANEAGTRLDDIRPGLDELSHATDEYRLNVGYAKGPYSETIAVIDLENTGGTWVAAWQVGTSVGGSIHKWQVTYNPHGVETQHEWFRNADDLFQYLTASIAERIVEMQADED